MNKVVMSIVTGLNVELKNFFIMLYKIHQQSSIITSHTTKQYLGAKIQESLCASKNIFTEIDNWERLIINTNASKHAKNYKYNCRVLMQFLYINVFV